MYNSNISYLIFLFFPFFVQHFGQIVQPYKQAQQFF